MRLKNLVRSHAAILTAATFCGLVGYVGEASAQNRVTVACGTTYSARLCQSQGMRCNDNGLPGSNPQDILDVTGVSPGTAVTFTLVNPSLVLNNPIETQIDPVDVSFSGNAGDSAPNPGFDGGGGTSGSVAIGTPRTVTHNVLASDGSTYSVMIDLTQNTSSVAVLDYSVMCVAPRAPTLSLVKAATNGDGTTQFSFQSNPSLTLPTLTPPANGATAPSTLVQLTAGTAYTVTEVTPLPTGWSLTSATCAVNGTPIGSPATNGVTFTPAAGQNVVCTFNNTRQNPTLTIVKAATNGDGTTAFNFTSSPSIGAIPALTPPANGSTQTGPIQLTAGTAYSLTENTPLPQGWSLTSAACAVNGTPIGSGIANGVSFTPTAGQNVICTFNNVRSSGSLTLTKVTLGGDGTFGFSGSGSTTFSSSITTVGGTGSTAPIQVNFGSVTIEESVAAGFDLTSITCNGGSPVVDLSLRRVTINVASPTQISCTFTNQRRGMVTIRKNTVGGDGTFSFSSSAPAVLPGFSLTTANGTASNVFSNVAPGTYTVTETVASGWTLSSIQCGGNATVDLAQKSATFTVAAGGDVICVFTNTEVRNRTSTIIRNFMLRRGDLITSDTGRPRLVERLQPSASGAGGPVSVTAMGDDSIGRMTFGTSMRQVMAYRAQQDAIRRAQVSGGGTQTAAAYDPIEEARAAFIDPSRNTGLGGSQSMGLGASGVPGVMYPLPANLGAAPPGGAGRSPGAAPDERTPRPGWDFWIEGKLTYFDFKSDWARSNGNFSLVKVGADYLVTPRLLAGALIQFDNLSDRSDMLGYKISGSGWMAGPYLEYRLTRNLIVDVKGLWGKSHNEISPFLTYVDSFDTTRWLASARLTGTWMFGQWHFSPRAEVVGYNDKQKGYTDSLGIYIPDQSVTIGRFIAGPEISYKHYTSSGTLIEPRLAAKGIWTFSQDNQHALGTLQNVPIDAFRVRLEAGLKLQSAGGTRLEVMGSREGFGESKLEASTGKAQLTLPLN